MNFNIYKSKVLIFTAIILIISLKSYSQQRPAFTQYMYNPVQINPGYASSIDHTQVNGLVRSQWVGFSGAPKTQSLSLVTPLNTKGLGLGVTILNDKIGPVEQYSISASIAYKITTSATTQLAFGLNFGGNMFDVDWRRGRYQNSDVLFNQNINNQFLPRLGVGLFFFSETYYIGLSVPNFLRSKFYNDIRESISKEDLTFYGTAGIVLKASEHLKFKPAILTTITQGVPISIDLSMSLLVNDKFSIGISHRFSDSISALLGLDISDNFSLGYAYDLNSSELQNYNSGTHEFFVRYQFNKEKTKNRFF